MKTPVATLAKLAVRNVFRNKRRSLLTLFAVILGVGSSVLLASIARGMAAQMIEKRIFNLTGFIQLHAPGYMSDPVVDHRFKPPSGALLSELEAAPVTHWAARVRVPGVVLSERESKGVTLVGIDPAQEKNLSIAGMEVANGRNLESEADNGVVVGKALLEALDTKLGRRVVLMSQGVDGKVADRGYRIEGVYDAELEITEKTFVFIGRSVLQNQLGMKSEISEISLMLSDREKVDAFTASLKQNYPDLDVKHWRELEPLVEAISSLQDGFLFLWFGVVMLSVGFGLVNTIFMGIYERVRELGVMQALGMGPRLVLFQIVVESWWLLVLGMLLGTVAGLGVASWLGSGIDISHFSEGAQKFGVGNIIFPLVLSSDVLGVNLLIFVIGTLGSLYPAWHASRFSPSEAFSRI